MYFFYNYMTQGNGAFHVEAPTVDDEWVGFFLEVWLLFIIYVEYK